MIVSLPWITWGVFFLAPPLKEKKWNSLCRKTSDDNNKNFHKSLLLVLKLNHYLYISYCVSYICIMLSKCYFMLSFSLVSNNIWLQKIDMFLSALLCDKQLQRSQWSEHNAKKKKKTLISLMLPNQEEGEISLQLRSDLKYFYVSNRGPTFTEIVYLKIGELYLRNIHNMFLGTGT